jgi:cytochrome P450 family 4
VDQSGTDGRSDHVDFCGHQDNCSDSKLYVLMLLPMHQDVQDKVYDEIVATFDGSKRPPQAEDLIKMVYLERIIKESMRLFPVVSGVARGLETDVQRG